MSDDDASTIPPSTRAAPPPEEEKANKPDAIHVSIPRELYLIPGTTASAGLALGFLRGARKSSLRFLAENAHRAPRTVEEWYFYHKTKNYRVLLGGLRASGREGVRLGTAGVVWVGLEEGARRAGLGAWREVCAGVGLAGIVSLAYRLPRRAGMQAGLLGLMGGSIMAILRRTQRALSEKHEEPSAHP